jgi:hypothetical protein
VKGQSVQVLKEIDRLLKLAGTDKTKVVSATIWVPDIRLRESMNEAWNAWTNGENLPGAPASRLLADPRLLVETPSSPRSARLNGVRPRRVCRFRMKLCREHPPGYCVAKTAAAPKKLCERPSVNRTSRRNRAAWTQSLAAGVVGR